MKLIIIRHAKALKREVFDGDDLERPLSKSGIKYAKKISKYISDRYDKIDLIVSSMAIRSQQTAQYIVKKYKDSAYMIDPAINPDNGIDGYIKYRNENKNIIIVGHEPDISQAILKICGIGNLMIQKGCIIEINLIDNQYKLAGLTNNIN